MYTLKLFILIFNSRFDTDLISSGYVVRHVLQASHHPLVPEVVRKRLRPFGQQLHQLGRHLTETDLKDITCHVKCCWSRHSVIWQYFGVLYVKIKPLDPSQTSGLAQKPAWSVFAWCHHLCVGLPYCSHSYFPGVDLNPVCLLWNFFAHEIVNKYFLPKKKYRGLYVCGRVSVTMLK